MTKRLLSVLLIGCLLLTGALPVSAQATTPVPLAFETYGITLPTVSDPDAPAVVLTDYKAWYAFASSFKGVDPACFSVRGSFEDRALLAVPMTEDGYVTSVEADDTTVYVTCASVGAVNTAQRYLMIATDPTAVRGKSLCVNIFYATGTAFETANAVACRGKEGADDGRVYTSREELSVLANDHYGAALDEVASLAAFDDAFFADNVLLYTALFTPSSGYALSVAPYALCTDSTILLRRVKTVPAYDDYTLSVIGCYAFLIPMPCSLYKGQPLTVMDETNTVAPYYPQGDSVPFEVLHMSIASRAQTPEPFGTVLRSYREWCAAIEADALLGLQYKYAVDETYFDDHDVALLYATEYFPPDHYRVYDVIRDGDRLTLVTEWSLPDTVYAQTLHARFVVGIPKNAADGVTAVHRHDLRITTSQEGDYDYVRLPDGTMRITACREEDSILVIPSHLGGCEVSAIGESLFLRNAAIDTVVLPDTVKTIETSAFQESSVRQVFLPEGLCTVEDHAFFACSRLDRLVIPSTVTRIGERAFGFGYYQDPAEPGLIPGSVGVREHFTMIADHNATAVAYAAKNGVRCRTPEDYPLGDTDFDGTVTTTDGRLLLQYTLYGYVRTWTVSDVNQNGNADTTDVRLLLRSLVIG